MQGAIWARTDRTDLRSVCVLLSHRICSRFCGVRRSAGSGMCKAVFAPALLAPARNVESVEGAPSAQKAEEAFVELCSIGDVVPTEETEEINRGSGLGGGPRGLRRVHT